MNKLKNTFMTLVFMLLAASLTANYFQHKQLASMVSIEPIEFAEVK